MARRLDIFSPEGFPLVAPGDDLSGLILDSLNNERLSLCNGDVLVLAQKIISKSEDRYVDLANVEAGTRARQLAVECDKDPLLVQLILEQSSEVLRCTPGVIIVRHKLGLVMANAGIDHSNIDTGSTGQMVLLLPRDPDSSARILRDQLEQATGLKLAVIINDSFGRPWRLGTTGVCIGSAGIASIIDQRGEEDLFGLELRVTQVALGDELATAASILMGQAGEARPLVVIRGLEYPQQPESATHLQRSPAEDLFQ